jgi:hypothetical protein
MERTKYAAEFKSEAVKQIIGLDALTEGVRHFV